MLDNSYDNGKLLPHKINERNNKIENYLQSTEEEKKKKLEKIYGEWKILKKSTK